MMAVFQPNLGNLVKLSQKTNQQKTLPFLFLRQGLTLKSRLAWNYVHQSDLKLKAMPLLPFSLPVLGLWV